MAVYQNLQNFNGLIAGDVVEYTYSGAVFPVIFRKATYKITAHGAQGGYITSSSNGGQGGIVVGEWDNKERDRRGFIYVGGSGNTGGPAGGFNGGGKRTTVDNYPGGGGASDVRLDADSLYHRLIVAGGGGSDSRKGSTYGSGGAGGGTSGANSGYYSSSYGGRGGSQTTGGSLSYTTNGASDGSFGVGGDGGWYSNQTNYNYGAGGGGWYGGGGSYRGSTSTTYRYAGGGGSGFVWTNQTLTLPSDGTWGLTADDALINTVLTQGGKTGDGLVTIEILALPPVYSLATDGTDTYAFTGAGWEIVMPGVTGPGVEDFLVHGVLNIPNFNGLPADSHLLVYDPEQSDMGHELVVNSNPVTQIITTKSGISLPFATTAEEPTITTLVDGGGTVAMTNWTQAGNKVSVEITMTKPDRAAEASVSEIKVPLRKGG